MLYFECPSCKANCSTTEAFAGKAVHCPHCGKSVTVPTDPTAVSSTPLPAKPKASSAVTTPDLVTAKGPTTPSIAKDGGGNGLRNFVLVVIAVVALTGLGVWLIPADSDSSTPSNGTDPVVVVDTSLGKIEIELFPDKAPISVKNFLKYVDKKHYDGTIFHRVIKDFMIQGGGFLPGMRGEKPGFPPIKNEARNGLKNTRGTVAMARTNDPDSATAQFFINTVDNSRNLGPGGVSPDGYAVFGKVISGMDVVDRIRAVKTGRNDVPIQDVVIKSIRRVQPKD